MKRSALLNFLLLLVLRSAVFSQEAVENALEVDSKNGFVTVQFGIPSKSMQEAIKNNMGNFGFGGGFGLYTNPFTWGKRKRNSPLRIGGEAGYTYYGRFLSGVSVNGYQGDYKTSYGIAQLNALLQLRPARLESITPFAELLAGGNFYISRTKENLDFIESSLGIENFELDSYSSASFNRGIAFGAYIGKKGQKSGRFVFRISYNRGTHIRYVVRNSLVYNSTSNRLQYEVGKAPVRYIMVQLGAGL